MKCSPWSSVFIVLSLLVGASSSGNAVTPGDKPWDRGPAPVELVDRSTDIQGFVHGGTSGDGMSGVAWFDYNNDGWLDFYATNGIGFADGLMHNNQDGTFSNRSEEAGLVDNNGSSGVAAADLDNDGDDDLVVIGDAAFSIGSPSAKPIRLFANNGDGTFTDVTASAGFTIPSGSPGVALQPVLGDINNDGLLDLFVTAPASLNNIPVLEPNHLFLNVGGLGFLDISAGSGVDYAGGACVAAFSHYDDDGLIDLFIGDCNIAAPPVQPPAPAVQATPLRLYKNNGDLTFTRMLGIGLPEPPPPETQPYPPVDVGFWMGLAHGDIDNDGDMDMFSTNVGDAFGFDQPHYLFEMQDDGTYEEIRIRAGVSEDVAPEFGWGCVFADFNNDGLEDLSFVGNIPPLLTFRNPGYLFINSGDNQFIKGDFPVDLTRKFASGLATADYDNDGDVDLLINVASYSSFQVGSDEDATPILLRNEGTPFHSITVRLIGQAPSNRSAIGAVVRVRVGNRTMTKEVTAGSSFASQNSPWLTFGLGALPIAHQIEITWPSGRVESYQGVRGDQVMTFTEGEATDDPLVNCSAMDPSGCVTVNVPGRSQQGYTFVDGSPERIFFGRPGRSILIDKDGEVVNSWDVGPFAKILPGGHVLGGLVYDDNLGGSFVYNDCFVELDWEGNVVWPSGGGILDHPDLGPVCDPDAEIIELDTDDMGRPVTNQHHDLQREGNPVGYFAPGQESITGGGKTLILSTNSPPLNETAHISDFPLFNDKIYEVEVDENGTTVLWEWDPIDHFEAGQGSPGDLGLGFDPIAKEAIRTIAVSGGGAPVGQHDWMHLNNINYLGPNRWCTNPEAASCDLRFHPDNIIWTSRNANISAIVAHQDHPNGDWLSGDIVWRLGPDYAQETGKVDQIIGPHHAHMIPRGLQGAGNILIFDNGGLPPAFGAGYGPDENGDPNYPNKMRAYSRVIEFDPNTLEIVWLYERPDPNPGPGENFAPFFSPFASGAQRLMNGNTMISEASTGRIFEVTRTGDIVWEFVSPFGPLPPLGRGAGGFGNTVYRAYHIPIDWIPAGE